ncbi:MAG: 2-oxoacid:acceptor oxidoreductase family protein [Burkholderiales bacterium]|nr:2-oxoacid:acceptor oxidoreductase family protein [Burkholderiales bacterium]
MFRIRLHGRGGQGIRTAGRVLGSAFFRAGFEVQDAPLYGAERRGAPIFACVRADREPIRERGLVARPDLVVLADETLAGVPAANVLLGLDAHTVFLVRSSSDAPSWRARLALAGPLVVLPADGTTDSASLAAAGAACAGAAARTTGAIARADLEAALREELAGFEPRLTALSIERSLAAFDGAAGHEGIVIEGARADASDYAAPNWIDVPFETASVSAPDIFAAATSVEVRTGLWRTLRPQIDYARCKRCSWVCSTFCPDSAIRVRTDGSPEIDFDHCKGCLVCVAVCPPHAIAAVPERAAAQASEAAPAAAALRGSTR